MKLIKQIHRANNVIQLYCKVTNAQGMCYGTKHTHTHTHTSLHQPPKKPKKTTTTQQQQKTNKKYNDIRTVQPTKCINFVHHLKLRSFRKRIHYSSQTPGVFQHLAFSAVTHIQWDRALVVSEHTNRFEKKI